MILVGCPRLLVKSRVLLSQDRSDVDRGRIARLLLREDELLVLLDVVVTGGEEGRLQTPRLIVFEATIVSCEVAADNQLGEVV